MIALVTADLSEQTVDDIDRPPLEAAFARRAEAEFVRWDADVDWSGYQAAVLRSTWDYPARWTEFGAWLEAVSQQTRLLNPLPALRWSLDKAYLGELAAGGVPVVATSYASSAAEVEAAIAALASAQVVVKPSVSAGSDQTGRFERADPAARDLAGAILARGKTVMIQPYHESVTASGEIAVVHFGGTYSHAFGKGPILDVGGGFVSGEYAEVVDAVTPARPWLETAERVLARYRDLSAAWTSRPEPLVYSRIDLIAGDDGEPLVLEVELVEPSFFFDTAPGSADRFVAAVLERLESPAGP